MTISAEDTAAERRLEDDFERLQSAVREAGALAMTHFRNGITSTRKADGSPVSEADLAADRLLRERLTAGDSPHGWLSEETADDKRRLRLRSVWVVDPIDGTRSFLDGTPEWTIVAALVVDGQPVLAAVFNPVTDEMFTARTGHGAFLNGKRLAVEDAATIDGARVMATKGMFKKPIWPQQWPAMRHSFVPSIAYRLMSVAAAKAHAALSITRLSEWDIAAATLIIREAGGIITALDGAPFTFNKDYLQVNGVVAAGPVLHQLLLERTKTVVAPPR